MRDADPTSFVRVNRKVYGRVASTYFFLGSILITVSVHTDREKVSSKPLIILIKALNEGKKLS